MATPNEQLLGMMNPQQARLLDQQMREQEIQQQSQGAGTSAGLMASALRTQDAIGNLGRSLFGGQAPQGLNEQMAAERQRKQEEVAGIIKGPQGPDRVQNLRDVANKLRASGTYEHLMLAEQYDDKADALQLKQDELNVNRARAAATASAGSAKTTDGHLMRDEAGNYYQTFNYKDKLGMPSVKYAALGGAPEYDGQSKLTPVSKSGDSIGMTAEEIVEAEVKSKVEIKSKGDFLEWKSGVLDDYSTAATQKQTMDRMIELTKELADSGDLQGGVSAKAQQLAYNVFGIRPKNLGELDMLFSMDSLGRLKPLFGGNISDGERVELRQAFPNILTSGKVNLEKLSVLENITNKAYATANKKINMTYEDWKEVLEKGPQDNNAISPTSPILEWTPEGWVRK